MRASIFILAIACVTACQKSKETVPDAPASSSLRIQLGGDILATEAPLPYGRRAGSNIGYARELRDSTLYAVMFRKEGSWYNLSRGLFHEPDSMWLDLPEEGRYRIIVVAVKRGTGPGLYYTLKDGVPYYASAFNSTVNNSMDTVKANRYDGMEDSISYDMFDPHDPAKFFPYINVPEADVYRADTTFDAASKPGKITLDLKRLAFGLQFSAEGFTTGKLLVNFSNWWDLPSKELTPENIDGRYFIHAFSEFKRQDTATYSPLTKISWVRTTGDTVVLGAKRIPIKRNILTHIRITLPTTGRTSANTSAFSYSEEPLP